MKQCFWAGGMLLAGVLLIGYSLIRMEDAFLVSRHLYKIGLGGIMVLIGIFLSYGLVKDALGKKE